MLVTNSHEYPPINFNKLLAVGVNKYVLINPTCGQTMNTIFVSPGFYLISISNRGYLVITLGYHSRDIAQGEKQSTKKEKK